MKQFILPVICAVTLTSCISSRITSNVDPFYKGEPKERFLFVMETGTPEFVKMMEEFAVENFEDYELKAVSYTKAIPPVREYSDSEKAELLNRANIQAYIRMRSRGMSTANVHIPSVSYTEARASATGGSGYASGRGSSATVTSGGYSTEVVTGIQFDCQVQDANSLQTIWTGYINVDVNPQNQYVTQNDYYEEVVQMLVKQLIKDRIAKKVN